MNVVRRLIGILGCLTALVFQKAPESDHNAAEPAPWAFLCGESCTLRSSTSGCVISASGSIRPLSAADSMNRGLATEDAPPLITLAQKTLPDVALDMRRAAQSIASALPGATGYAMSVGGHGGGDLAGLEKTVRAEVFDDVPGVTFFRVIYYNAGNEPLRLSRVEALRWLLKAADPTSSGSGARVWSFHGSAEWSNAPNLLALYPGFQRDNRMGSMTRRGRGGGIPLVAFWTRAGGWALGLAETTPRVFAIPVRVRDDGRAEVAITIEPKTTLAPGERYRTPLLFVADFEGDFFNAVRAWRGALEKRGLKMPAPSTGSGEPNWCSWGFGRRITPETMLRALPKVADLGFRWATLDDGWFDRYGDGAMRPFFEKGGMQRVVDGYQERGIRMMLWWLPLTVEDGTLRRDGRRQKTAQIALEHPEWLILDESGRPARTFGNLALMCPALPAVQEYHRQLTRRFIAEWGFHGLKIDKIYTVPECHNPTHHHQRPDESIERMGEVFQAIFEEARSIRRDCVVQICPCAKLPNLAWLPYMNQPVTADPADSAQVRWRIKMYKAIYGERAPVFADHVELTRVVKRGSVVLNLGRDFASAVGAGGVPGTRFVWPSAAGFEDVNLTPEKERHFRHWLAIYRRLRLSEGTFLNLYRHGFDAPEGYAIRKNGRMYYAFYDDGEDAPFEGTIELRGLGAGRFRVVDYENDRRLGFVEGPVGRLEVRFKAHLMLETITDAAPKR